MNFLHPEFFLSHLINTILNPSKLLLPLLQPCLAPQDHISSLKNTLLSRRQKAKLLKPHHNKKKTKSHSTMMSSLTELVKYVQIEPVPKPNPYTKHYFQDS